MTASAALEYAKRAGEDYWGDFVSPRREAALRGRPRARDVKELSNAVDARLRERAKDEEAHVR
jgi:hypothetical protein